MFTGLVEDKVKVQEIIQQPGGIRLVIAQPAAFKDVTVGDSLAINGCCLTVVELQESSLAFQAGQETLSRTNLGKCYPGGFVNIERSMLLGMRLGGHIVSGHIDAVGRLVSRDDADGWCRMIFEVPQNLTRQMASKGSITVDGVSLTLVDVSPVTFSVALIPHTLHATTLGDLPIGGQVNIETDLLAKYVEQQLVMMEKILPIATMPTAQTKVGE